MEIYYFGIKFLFLFGLVRSFVKFDPLQDRILFLAALYTAGLAFLSYVFLVSPNPSPNLYLWKLWLAKTFGLTLLYFWLLRRFDEGAIFWVLLLGGGVFLLWF